MKTLRVGIRPSSLALRQAEEIIRQFTQVNFEIITIATKGDKDKLTPLSLQEKKDFFTYEIEQALIRGEIDLAVHSAKDLEDQMPQELLIVALTKSVSKLDCLVSKDKLKLNQLSAKSIVGTSSKARKKAILQYRKDLLVRDIRGNIEERLAQLDKDKFSAIIVAQAALIRLGLEKRISQVFPVDIVKPHPLQGRLAIQIKKDRIDLFNVFRSIDEQ